ncbi:unnamed protein product [Phytophthora fragariaefolia]|uniref:Unnamed protein product n=1 Tax=Phytophthora fragariaefolia TaxID=1490495 RepID=A0A9W6YBY6_9STRA|nr:unnamed protein product [Phytophthora fragariaefolia]
MRHSAGTVFSDKLLSIFRQAIEHGSLGLQRMQLDELGDSDLRRGQTPGRMGHASFYGEAPQPLFQEHRPPPMQPTQQDSPKVPMPPGQQQQALARMVFGYPNHNHAKLSIRAFDGRETYEGLGSGFEQWGLMFIVQMDMAERACGFKWPEEVKLSKLAQHLTGKAGRFFRELVCGRHCVHTSSTLSCR